MSEPSVSVLVVDDDDVDREMLVRSLSVEYAVVEAATADDALAAAKNASVLVALVDYRLPDMDGLHLAEKLIDQGVAVVMLTGQGNETVAVNAMKLGADDYLTKAEADQTNLLRVVANVLKRVELRERLRDKQRELEEFVDTAAHDLKAPLHSLRLGVYLLKKSFQEGDQEKAAAQLDKLSDLTGRMGEFVNELLEYTRIGRRQVELETADMNEVTGQALAALEGSIVESQASIDVGDLPRVLGDSAGLSQLMQNLLANAIKFSGDEPPHITVRCQATDQGWRFSVTDKGIGVDPEDSQRIFRPLQRGSRGPRRDGIGLGLAVCAKIVQQHGGAIQVEANQPVGASFVFTLPKNGE